MRVKQTEIHRLANVAVGFGPGLADFENFERGKFVAATIHDRGDALEQARALFKRSPTPFPECGHGGFERALRFRNSRFGLVANDLVGFTRVYRSDRFVRPNFVAADDERIFLAESLPDFAQGRAHLLLGFAINEIHERGIFVGVARRRVTRCAIACMSILRGSFEILRAIWALADKFNWIAQQCFGGNVLGKFRAQETFVGSVLEQTPNEIGHAGQQLADRTIFADAITHFDQRALDRAGHSVEQLKLETAAVDAEFFGERLRVRDAADVVRTERRGDDRFVLEQDARERFEIRVALGLLQIHRNVPAVLAGFNFS